MLSCGGGRRRTKEVGVDVCGSQLAARGRTTPPMRNSARVCVYTRRSRAVRANLSRERSAQRKHHVIWRLGTRSAEALLSTVSRVRTGRSLNAEDSLLRKFSLPSEADAIICLAGFLHAHALRGHSTPIYVRLQNEGRELMSPSMPFATDRVHFLTGRENAKERKKVEGGKET